MLGSNPDLRLIAASHTHELAVAMNRDVQRIMDRKMMKSAGVPKIARIRRLTPYVTQRELRFRQDSPGCRRLVDQSGLSPGRARRRPQRAGDVYAAAGGIEPIEIERVILDKRRDNGKARCFPR